MLQRAASNAYSWWWASHIRTKHSKWLEQNLQDMEYRVCEMLKIIDDDGDSFSQRAEMYYRKRPELINHVEDSYRSYRALAERFDHLSKELQSANRTIASAFPEQVQFSMDAEDEENHSETSTYSNEPEKTSKPNASIPKVPAFPMKYFRTSSMRISKKGLKRTPSSAKVAVQPKSGLSTSEALDEISKLQKGILALQTEKEFLESSYEHGYEKYWDIENHITEMQARVSSLQDEFGIGTVIEDNEARTLMTAKALNSCQETLARLQEKQEQSVGDARAEYQRILEAHEKFINIRNKFISMEEQGDRSVSGSSELKELDPQINSIERGNEESLRKKFEEQLALDSNESLTVTKVAERVDEIVEKIVNLESAVYSQTALVNRLRSETDQIQAHIQSLERDKEALTAGSENINNRLKALEEELRGIKTLNRNFEDQNSNFQTHFTEANCNIVYLSEKLQSAKMEQDGANAGLFPEARAASDAKAEEREEKQRPADTPVSSKDTQAGMEEKKNDQETVVDYYTSKKIDEKSENHQESSHEEEDEKKDMPETASTNLESEQEDLGTEEGEDISNWRRMSNGLEEREKILLDEYTSVLQNYKDVKRKLCEVEKKNRDGFIELALQIRALENAVAFRDEEIQSLRHKLSSRQVMDNTVTESNQEGYHDSIIQSGMPPAYNFPSPGSLQEQNFEYEEEKKSPKKEDKLKVKNANSVPTIEEKIRLDFDELSSPHTVMDSNLTESDREGYPDSIIQSGISPAYNFSSPGSHQEENFEYKERKESPMKEEKLKAKVASSVPTIEEKFRLDIDELLEQNLEFWLRFSTSFHQIQKLQTTVHDLKAEITKLKDNKRQEGTTKHSSMNSDFRAIYKHLREIQTELTLWLENNEVLKEELNGRYSTLCNLEEEIARVSNSGGKAEESGLNHYQAAKFQGEVLNMKQENTKIADEINAGGDNVKQLKMDVEATLTKLEEEIRRFGRSSSTWPKIPLHSFLFGVKLKRQRQKASIFSCMNPSLQKQYSNVAAGGRLRLE